MSLVDKLIKNTTLDMTSQLDNSAFFNDKDIIPTPVPMVNVALSGRVDGGLTSGVTVLAGPSKNFKTGFSLLFAASYLKKYPDGAILFYDSEFGTPQSYFKTFSIPLDRVVHTPITDIEQLKHDVINQLKGLDKKDKVIIVIDSIGNLASKKEVDDATEGKSVADMTRAKALKSLFRMITPYATIKDVPIVAINHTYMEQAMYPRAIVSGGTGIYYSADNIWILGRQQEKDSDGITGYNFVINVEKSRFVKEKSKIPITVSFENGIQKWAGLFDTACDMGYIESPTKGWYQRLDQDQKHRRADIEYSKEFWNSMFEETDFKEALRKKYSLTSTEIMKEEEDELE